MKKELKKLQVSSDDLASPPSSLFIDPPRFKKDHKFCPFISSSSIFISCSPGCSLYNSNRNSGYHCSFSDIGSISWRLSQLQNKKKNNE
jgi:hypothetical protein